MLACLPTHLLSQQKMPLQLRAQVQVFKVTCCCHLLNAQWLTSAYSVCPQPVQHSYQQSEQDRTGPTTLQHSCNVELQCTPTCAGHDPPHCNAQWQYTPTSAGHRLQCAIAIHTHRRWPQAACATAPHTKGAGHSLTPLSSTDHSCWDKSKCFKAYMTTHMPVYITKGPQGGAVQHTNITQA